MARQEAREQRRATGLPEPSPKPVKRPEGWLRSQMSYWGMAGGLWATSNFLLVAVLTAASDQRYHLAWGAFYAVMALLFVPAIVFSMMPSPRRNAVLRADTALCLVLAVASLFILDWGLRLLLVPATLMLSTGAGIVFGANRPKSER